ncbi:MAG: acyl-CoA desaturase [Cytophagales bacterium]
MQKLRFINNNKEHHLFITSLRKRVRSYFDETGQSSKGNSSLYIKALILVAMYIVPFALLMFFPFHFLIAFSLCVIMGIGLAGVGMSVMHDGAHGVFSQNKFLNKVAASTGYLLGSNTINWKVQHNVLHHTYTNIHEMDPDIETKAVIRLNENAPLKKYQKFQHIYALALYSLMTLSKIVKDFSQLINYSKSGYVKMLKANPSREMLKLVLSKSMYVALFLIVPIVFSPFLWWQVLLGFLLVHITAGMILSLIFQMAHVVEGTEQPNPNGSDILNVEWAVHEIMTTANFAPHNRILNWYIGGLNFQIEHHLFPNISHIHYKNIAPIVARTVREFGLHYNVKPSFRNALVSHIKRLKQLGNPVIA